MNNHMSAHDIRKIAVEACRDPRSVSRFLRGGKVRPTVAASIESALARLDIRKPDTLPPVRGSQEGAP